MTTNTERLMQLNSIGNQQLLELRGDLKRSMRTVFWTLVLLPLLWGLEVAILVSLAKTFYLY